MTYVGNMRMTHVGDDVDARMAHVRNVDVRLAHVDDRDMRIAKGDYGEDLDMRMSGLMIYGVI